MHNKLIAKLLNLSAPGFKKQKEKESLESDISA